MAGKVQQKLIAVFCGSQLGNDGIYATHARQIGELLVQQGYGLVYGGGKSGLMGAVADAVMDAGGKVVGIIPQHLELRERHHTGISELHVVQTMHERKAMMYELCEAAIILAGGYGTMDEFFEMITWNQLALHNKPIYVLNSAGFYTDLLQLLQTMHSRGFLYLPYQEATVISDLPDRLMTALHERLSRG